MVAARALDTMGASATLAPAAMAGKSVGSPAPLTIASTPAVVNAVIDAIRHLGVADVTMPCTPQTVWRALQAATEGGAE